MEKDTSLLPLSASPPLAAGRDRSADETEAASQSANAAATPSWQQKRWSDLTTDFLQCITAFLPLECLPTASLVCRGWRIGIDTMGARGDRRQIPLAQVIPVLDSPLRRHIASLVVVNYYLRPETFHLLRFAMPQLTSLECRVELLLGADRQHLYLRPPMQLRELIITLWIQPPAAGVASLTAATVWLHLERALDDMTQVRTLTTLVVYVSMDDEAFEIIQTAIIPLRTLQPLSRLRGTLTKLHIEMERDPSEPLAADHVDLIRSMDRLTELDMSGLTDWSPAELEWLTADPMPMRLKKLNLESTFVEAGHAVALARLTSLTAFSSPRLDLRDPSFLAQMTQLTSVRLNCTSEVDPALLVCALSHCGRVGELEVQHDDMTDAHLCTLLPSLPLLKELKLFSMDSLTGLSFASTVPHLAHTLDTLQLFRCPALPLTELHHLRALTALRDLACQSSFNEPLDSYTFSSMTPSSACFARNWWPQLTEFYYMYSPPV